MVHAAASNGKSTVRKHASRLRPSPENSVLYEPEDTGAPELPRAAAPTRLVHARRVHRAPARVQPAPAQGRGGAGPRGMVDVDPARPRLRLARPRDRSAGRDGGDGTAPRRR